jgi:hypothetical protein
MYWNFEITNEKNTLGCWIGILMAFVRKTLEVKNKKMVDAAFKTSWVFGNECKITYVYSAFYLTD